MKRFTLTVTVVGALPSTERIELRDTDPSADGAPLLRTCLLVLGMHRSGTSAVCGVLHQLGAERPVREMEPQVDNEKGFFEPSEIAAIHDRMLASAAMYWFDWEPMPQSWYGSAAHDAFLAELVAAARYDFPGRGPFLLKDPRICRFVDVWLAALDRIEARPVIVFQYRDPLEVARSLKARNGFSIAHGLLMWLRHNIDAEKASRHVERSFTSFTGLLNDWQAELAAILKSTSVQLPKTSARALSLGSDFLDSSLRHQVKAAGVGGDTLHEWFANAYAAFEQLRVDPYDSSAMASLDIIRRDFETASAAFSPVYHDLLLQVDRLGRTADRVITTEAALASSQQKLADVLPVAERVPIIEYELAQTREQLASIGPVAARIPSLEADLDGARRALEESQIIAGQVPSLQADLEAARQTLAGLQAGYDRIPELQTEVEASRLALAAVQPIADRVPGLKAGLEAARQALVSVQAVANRVPGLESELQNAQLALAAAQRAADRIPGLEADLATSVLVRTQLEKAADRLPGLESDLEKSSDKLSAAQLMADRVPLLEADLTSALHALAEQQTLLDTTTLQLNRTLGRRLATALGFRRGETRT